MLKKIPSVISPELMKVLMEMGHGDEICLADGNFPAAGIGKRVVRLDGHGIEEILSAVLTFFPLDMFVERPVSLMKTVSESEAQPDIWGKYEQIIKSGEENKAFSEFEMVERFAFYERTKNCYAVVATGETAIYANMILKKGIVA